MIRQGVFPKDLQNSIDNLDRLTKSRSTYCQASCYLSVGQRSGAAGSKGRRKFAGKKPEELLPQVQASPGGPDILVGLSPGRVAVERPFVRDSGFGRDIGERGVRERGTVCVLR